MRLAVAAAIVLAAPLASQAPPPPPPPPCAGAEFRQFDFWIGDWIVEHPANGQRQGTNAITRDLNGCVLTERWVGAGGSRGTSFNMYDRRRGVWHQTWVDDSGNLLLLDGRLDGASMVLRSEPVPGPAGGRVINRITWTPLEGGRVRQHWETSSDSGTTWQTSFLGVYRPRA